MTFSEQRPKNFHGASALTLLLILVFGAIPEAKANELRLGLGGTYSQLSLPISSSSSASYSGIGGMGELRLRFVPKELDKGGNRDRGFTPTLSVDLFALYRIQPSTNAAVGVDEKGTRRSAGLGMDFNIWRTFIGLQATTNTLKISDGSGASRSLNFVSLAGRLGIKLPLWATTELLLGGLADFGMAPLASDPSAKSLATEFAGFAVVSFKLF